MINQSYENSPLPAGEGQGEGKCVRKALFSWCLIFANQLHQVLRTYYTRRDFWIFTFIMFIFFFVSLRHSLKPTGRFEDTMPVVIINITIGFIVGMQIKIQYANPRARLLPGFTAAHLIVPASIITMALLLEVGFLANVYGVSYFALVGYGLFLIAAASWNSYVMRNDFNFLFIIFMFASMFLPKYFVVPFLTGGIFVSTVVFCIGSVALAALGVRLSMLCEEMPEYARVMPGSTWDFMSRSARRDRGRLEAQMIARSRTKTLLQDIMFRLVFQNKTASNPPRQLLLRQLAGGFSSVFLANFLFTFILVIFWFPRLFSMAMEKGSITSCFMMFSYVVFLMTVSMISGLWLRRWQYLVRESLFPISRIDFARELVRSSMFDMAVAAVGFCAGMIVGLVVFQPEWLLSGSTPLYISMTVAQFFIVGCVMLYVVSFRSFIYFLFGSLGIIFVSMALIFLAISGYWYLSLASIVATAAGIVGAYRLAFRQWCDIDLD